MTIEILLPIAAWLAFAVLLWVWWTHNRPGPPQRIPTAPVGPDVLRKVPPPLPREMRSVTKPPPPVPIDFTISHLARLTGRWDNIDQLLEELT